MSDSNKCLKLLLAEYLVKLKQLKELIKFYENKQIMFSNFKRLSLFSDDDKDEGDDNNHPVIYSQNTQQS